jgi:hypothetical protein
MLIIYSSRALPACRQAGWTAETEADKQLKLRINLSPVNISNALLAAII